MRRNLWLALASIAVFLLAAELGLRLHDASQGRSLDSPAVVRPYRIFGPNFYTFDRGRLQIRSRHGETFPFEKPAETWRIVVFGGSTTVNKEVYEQSGIHYPLALQRLLRTRLPERPIEVINVANEAYATSHSLTILALDVLSWKPDLVILSHNFNDLTASYYPEFVPDYSHKFSHDYYTPGLEEFLWKRSRLYGFVESRLRVLRRFPVQRRSYGPAPPALAGAVFERNLRAFVTLAQANGIGVVLGSQPLAIFSAEEFDEDLGNKPYNAVVVYPRHEEFVRHHQAFNTVIETVARSTGSVFVDNDRSFGGDPALFSDIVHYTQAGVERLAGNYAEGILAAGLLTDQEPAVTSRAQ